jgi:hypothetical protein
MKDFLIGNVLLALILCAGWWWISSEKPVRFVWVVNAGKEPAALEIGGKRIEPKRGGFAEATVPVGVYQATLEVGGKRETLAIEVGDAGTILVDATADGAYAILDITPYFDESPGAMQKLDDLALVHTSPPALVHRLPYTASAMIAPGRNLPPKVLTVKGATRVNLAKVFRIPEARLADKPKLAKELSTTLFARELKAAAAATATAEAAARN